MTGLLNKTSLEESLKGEILQAARQQRRVGIMFLDVDDFKAYNTTYGHMGGDEILRFVASVLKENLYGFARRNGGDEFVTCVTVEAAIDRIDEIAENILQRLEEGCKLANVEEKVKVYCSIGIAIYPNTADTYEELLLKADKAMYHVKNHGKSRFVRVDC